MDLFHSIFYTSVPWLFATFTDLLIGGWLVDEMCIRDRTKTKYQNTCRSACTSELDVSPP